MKVRYTLLLLLLGFSLLLKSQVTGNLNPCVGSQQVYSISSSGGFLFWSVNGSNITQNLADGSFLIQWVSPGSYTVRCVHTVSPGHIDTATQVVTVHPTPMPEIVPLNAHNCMVQPKTGDVAAASSTRETRGRTLTNIICYSVCDSGWYSYTAKGFAGSLFSWISDKPVAIVPNTRGDTVRVHWTSYGFAQLTMIETSAYGCVDSTAICIDIEGRPKACFHSIPEDSAGTIRVCLGTSISFSDSCSSIPQYNNIMSKSWILGDGAVLSDQSLVTHAYNVAGDYIVAYVLQTNCFCTDTYKVRVHVDPLPGPQIFCIKTVCHGSSAVYYTDDTCSHTYTWGVNGGTITRTSRDSVFVNWGSCNNGYGVVSLISDCPAFCPYKSEVRVPVVPENANMLGDTIVCYNESGLYSVPFVPSTIYKWHELSATPSLSTPYTLASNTYHYTFNTTSSYQVDSVYIVVEYTNPFLHCSGTSILKVYVTPQLRTYITQGDTLMCQGNPLSIVASDGNSVICKWYVYSGSNTTPVSVYQGYNYTSNTLPAGSYTIYAYPVSGLYCNAPVVNHITIVAPPPVVQAPVIGQDTVCPGVLFDYYSTPTDAALYYLQWSAMSGVPATGAGYHFSTAWVSPLPDTLVVTQIMIKAPACASAPKYVYIRQMGNIHPDIVGEDTVCSDAIELYKTNTEGDNYKWTIDPTIAGSLNFGQNTDSISVQWNHFTTATSARLILEVKKCGGTYLDTLHVLITPAPTPAVTVSNGPYCTGSTITFTSSLTGSKYVWDYGDGTADTVTGTQTTTHSFAKDTTFTVRLTLYNPSGCLGSSTVNTTISVLPSPSAYLSTPGILNHCGDVNHWTNELIVTLQNMSTLSIQYTFYTSPAVPPLQGPSGDNSYIADKVGSYYAVVVSAAGCSGTTNTIYIDSACGGGPGCSSNYTFDFDTSKVCNTVAFTSLASSPVVFGNWDFGDPTSGNNSSSSSTPTHIYAHAGYYHVTASASAPSTTTGSCTIYAQHIIQIPLVADMTVQFSCSHDSMLTKLIDISTFIHAVTSRTWYVNGVAQAHTTADVELALAPGTYTIMLQVSNGGSPCYITKTIVVPAPCVANFSADDSLCYNLPIQLHDSSTGNITSYLWDYGDGSSSALKNSAKVYMACTASNRCADSIKLIVTDIYGCQSTSAQAVYYFKDNLAASSFTITPPSILTCDGSPQAITVHNTGTGTFSNLHYSWNNGQVTTTSSINITQGGTYTVTVSDAYKCQKLVTGSSTVIFNTIQGLIVGDTNYCYNENTNLNIFQGYQYEYYWILDRQFYGRDTTSPSSQGYQFNYGVNIIPYLDNALIWGVIRNRISQTQYCDDVVGPVRIHIYPQVNGTGLTPIPNPACVDHDPVTFIVSHPAGCYTLWPNGSISDTLIVTDAGNYTTQLIDTNGCLNTGPQFTAYAGPDFSQLIYGCYNFCLGDTIVIPGPVSAHGSVSAFSWLKDGMPYNSSNIVSQAGDVRVWQNGTYQMVLTSSWPALCKDTSKPIFISFDPCDSTCFHSYDIRCSKCYIDSSENERHLHFILRISDPLTASLALQVLSNDLDSVKYWPNMLLNPGPNYLHIEGIDRAPFKDQYCVELKVHNCHQKFCIDASNSPCVNLNQRRMAVVNDEKNKKTSPKGKGKSKTKAHEE